MRLVLPAFAFIVFWPSAAMGAASPKAEAVLNSPEGAAEACGAQRAGKLSGREEAMATYVKPADAMTAYNVSTLINSPKNDSAECVNPMSARV